MFYMDELWHIVYQMLDFLPQRVKNALSYLNFNFLYEIRMRAEKPITINYQGKYRYLGEFGLCDRREKALISDINEIEDCVFKAGKYSVYSIEEQLKKGFLTAENGERIGLVGEYTFEKGQPLSLRNFTSICIRVPHEIIGSGLKIYNSCMRDKVRSVLIMSPPGLGKTTILRDLSRILSQNALKNILICDERGEISAGDTGFMSDIVKFADKSFALEAGVRAMRPDIIITDELSENDCIAIKKVLAAGICVIASAHFSDIKHIKPPFSELFERYVVLNSEKIGEISAIYDAQGEKCEF